MPIISVGGVGVVSVATHLAGKQVKEMVTAALDGDWEKARALHMALAPLNKALFLEPNPQPVKAALSALWEPVGDPRLPLIPASEETVRAVREGLDASRRS